MDLILNPCYYIATDFELKILKSISIALNKTEEDVREKLTSKTISTISDLWNGFRCEAKDKFTDEYRQLFDEYKVKFGIEK